MPTVNGVNPGLFTPAETREQQDTAGSMPPPPPRPPRRVYHPSIDQPASTPPPTASTHSTHSRTSSSHAPSHSLSSLSMLTNPNNYEPSASSPVPSTPGSAGHGSYHDAAAASAAAAGVSRTQSLRAHMHHNPQTMVDISTLGRSASMRTPGELSYSRLHQSPPPPPPPFSLATPPRNKGHLPHYAPSDDGDVPGADLQRHHSLGRSQALLSLDQREDLRRRLAASPGAASQTSAGTPGEGHSRHISEIDQSLGRNLWTPGVPAPGEDGWSGTNAAQQLQDALDALSLRDTQPGQPHRHAPPMGEEPAWVTNLVGMPGQPSPTSQARQLGGGWDDRNAPSPYSLGQWGSGPSLQPPPLLYQQQQQLYAQTQAQLKLAASGLGGAIPVHHGLPPMHLQQGYMGGNYLGTPFNAGGYATPPGPLPSMPPGSLGMPGGPVAPMSAQDVDVMELARKKGLNPATFDCRPPYARFFVIKSYTEDDVQKSLKHEVWSSTVLGNKRLDNAWRESHDKGP